MEILPAARARLQSSPTFVDLIGHDVGATADWPDGWLFSEVDAQGMPPVDIEQSGTSAVVLGLARSSMQPSLTSMRFRTLRVLIFADDTRSDDGLHVADARDRCERVADAVIGSLADPGFTGGYWGDLYVIASHLQADLSVIDVPTTDGCVRGDVAFDLAIA